MDYFTPDFPVNLSKVEKREIKKVSKKHFKSLSNNLNLIDTLLYQQQKQQNSIVDPPDEMRIDFCDGGVFLGRDSSSTSFYIGKPQQEDGHILIVGSPGCHKTTGIILPSILTWQGTFVAVDIKGDITEFCRRHRKGIAYPVQIIDFSGECNNTLHFDPFLQLRTGGEAELISNARDLALSIIPTPNNIFDSLFWVQGAQNILTAIILYAFGHGLNFNEMVEMALNTPMEKLQKAIIGSDNDAAKSFIMQYSANPSAHSDIRTLQGSFIEMTNYLRDFYHPQVQNVFSVDGEVVDLEKETLSSNFVIRIPEPKLHQWGGAVRLILKQLFSVLSSRPETYSPKGHWQPPFLLLWDEMPRFGKFEDLVHAFSTLRSKGITICTAIQSFAQLDYIYDPTVRRALVDCCSYIAIGTVQDVDTQQFCSALIGSSPAWDPGVGENFYPNRKEFSFSRNLNLLRKPLLYPEEFAFLNCFVISSPFGKFFVEKSPLFESPKLPIHLLKYTDIGTQTTPKKNKKRERTFL